MPTTRICRVGAERTHTPHAVMEAALAHVVRNKAEAAYARRDLFEKRRALMESWSTTSALERLRAHGRNKPRLLPRTTG